MEKTKTKFDSVLDEDENGEFCVVPLKRKGLEYYAKIDLEDYDDISQYVWYAAKSNKKGTKMYARRNVLKKEGGKRGEKELMHRRIMGIKSGIMIDHKNRDGLDNRKQNLRIADKYENSWNREKAENKKSSKYKGVVWHKISKKWEVKIQYRTKKIQIGYYIDEIKAAKAYDKEAKKYYGVFARLNFPEVKMSYRMDENEKEKNNERNISNETLGHKINK